MPLVPNFRTYEIDELINTNLLHIQCNVKELGRRWNKIKTRMF